jgi:hypothetical protein
MPLPNQKSTTNCVATKSEIGSQKLWRCQFRNRQPNCSAADSKIGSQKLSLPIQKSAAMVESFRFTSLFFFPGVYNYNGNNNFPS